MEKSNNNKKVVFFGPWTGEFGWELMSWNPWCRREAKKYDKVYVCSFPEMEFIYKDFAEFIPHDLEKRDFRLRGGDRANYEVPKDVTIKIEQAHHYKDKANFIKFSNLVKTKFDYLIHIRQKNDARDYPIARWKKLVAQLEGTVACVGTKVDGYIEGTCDLRGLTLEALMDVIASSKLVVGGSSGIMHLAALCGTDRVVWHGPGSFKGGNVKIRYKEVWNPFNVGTEMICGSWRPKVEEIIETVRRIRNGKS